MASIDVIIPVYRPDEKMNRLLDALEMQTVKPERIILVHTGEVLKGEPDCRADVAVKCDGTVADAVARLEKKLNKGLDSAFYEEKRALRILCMIPKDKFDHGGSRNLGAALSRSEVMVFMTQDAVPADEHLLEELTRALFRRNISGAEHPMTEAAVAYARQLPYEDCRAVEQYTREFNYPETSELRTKRDIPVRGIKTFCNSNVCAAYRRDIFELLGGFALKTIFNEDMLFAAKAVDAGYGVAYAADANVYHSHNLGLADQFHRNFDNAVSQAENCEVFAAVSSEKEGIKLVKYVISRMKEDGRLYMVPYFVLNCACRYAGFFLGKRYQKLPGWLVKKCSLNKRYWI